MKGTRLICNIIIFLVASQRLPEFQGYKGRAYPGQPAPCHQLMPVPRRMSLPPEALSDWKKIGSKRNSILIFDKDEPTSTSTTLMVPVVDI